MLIYKATSKTTGKVYIGQTSQSLQRRINQHKCHSGSKNYHFYNAIKKYGFDDFVFEVVEDNIKTKEELNERERYWIKFYDSYRNGYNTTLGGDGSVRRDEETILKFFYEGKNIKEISEITDYSRGTIGDVLRQAGLSEENNERQHQKTRLRCGFPVEQYDLEGNFIQEFPSASEAAKQLNGEQGAISALCRQEKHCLSYFGFLFKYKNDSRPIQEWIKRLEEKKPSGKKKKKVVQLDENGNLIKIYESAADAARVLNLKDKSNICRAARKECKAYNCYWKYCDESEGDVK